MLIVTQTYSQGNDLSRRVGRQDVLQSRRVDSKRSCSDTTEAHGAHRNRHRRLHRPRRLYERALAVLEPRDQDGRRLRCDLLLALGDAQRRAGNPSYRETVAQAVDVARALGDGEHLARAALASARPGGFMASANAVDHELLALFEEAAAGLGEVDSLLRARLLGQLAVELVYTSQDERRDALSREAIAIARRLSDPLGLAQVLILRLIAFNNPFTLTEWLDLSAELAVQAEALGSSELAWHASFHRAGALLESGNVSAAERPRRARTPRRRAAATVLLVVCSYRSDDARGNARRA